MSLANIATGEIFEPLSPEEAERLTMRISLKLDAMADTYAGVMPLIREAIERQAFAVLGYRSVGEYIAERFGGALSKLGVEIRREVVRELSEAGMSTRAIAPVVGTSHMSVKRDLDAGVTVVTPEPIPADLPKFADFMAEHAPAVECDTDDDPDDDEEDDAPSPGVDEDGVGTTDVATVVGIDGKKYKQNNRRLPRPAAEKTLNTISYLLGKAAREAQSLTPEQIRRIRKEADQWADLSQHVEVLQHLVASLTSDKENSK